MPIYEYRCRECEQIFEEWQKDFEEREQHCPVCSGAAERIISNTSFVLKGSGWYVTDYCNKSSSNSGNGGASGNGDGKAKTDAGSKPSSEGGSCAKPAGDSGSAKSSASAGASGAA